MKFYVAVDGAKQFGPFGLLSEADARIDQLEESGLQAELAEIVAVDVEAGSFEYVILDSKGFVLAGFMNEGDIDEFVEAVDRSEGYKPTVFSNLGNGTYKLEDGWR